MRMLICPLDWGLGHATRCIPLIRVLRAQGHVVVILATGSGRNLLQKEFPDLEVGSLPGFSMRYAKQRFLQPFWLFAQLPFFLLSAWRDHQRINSCVKSYKIDWVISDGRYGLRSSMVPSVLISHQLCVLPPGPRWWSEFWRSPLFQVNKWVLRNYVEIWVPDFSGDWNLSGRLAHDFSPWSKVRYIGPLSRFRPDTLGWDTPLTKIGNGSEGTSIDFLALVSGPEPQRTLFEEKLLVQLRKCQGTRVLIRGLPDKTEGNIPQSVKPGKLTVLNHLPEKELFSLLMTSKNLICRSGYTSVMELAGLGRTHILMIPTPGQPEQEYLAEHLGKMGFVAFQPQEKMNLEIGLEAAAKLPGFSHLFAPENPLTPTASLTEWIGNHLLFAPGDSQSK